MALALWWGTSTFRKENMTEKTEVALRESERRHRHIFQATGVSIWEEDFSRVKAAVDAAKRDGVSDFREYLRTTPDFVDEHRTAQIAGQSE